MAGLAGERVLVDARPHGRALTRPVVALVVLCFLTGAAVGAVERFGLPWQVAPAAALVGVALAVRRCLVPLLRWRATRLLVTDARVCVRSGVLRQRSREVDVGRVADVAVERSLGQRLVGAGTLVLVPAGDGVPLVLRDVAGVDRVAAAVLRAARSARP